MLHDLQFRLSSLLRRGKSESDMDDELRFHCERQAEKYVAAGVGREEAQRRARLDFGGLDAVKEECREARGTSAVETFLQDTRYALRVLRKSPAFTIIAVLTLAVGIGANTAIFSVLDGVLLKPLPYPHPEQLVSVELSPLALDPSVRGIAPEDYFIFREQSRTLQDVGIYLETDTDRDVNVTGFAEPERVHALNVTGSVLSLLGVPPMLGRVFTQADDLGSAAPTVVLTYSYWQRKFGGDRNAVGKAIDVDGKAREIIGVMPRDFRFLDEQELALILPLQLDRNRVRLGAFGYFGVARMKPGVTVAEASADIARLMPVTFESFPVGPGLSVDYLKSARLTPILLPLKDDVVGNAGTVLWVLMGGIGMVLLIACANVANLLLVRTEGRRHELALRSALGATRRRIAGQLLRESVVLGVLGGIAGLVLTWGALGLLVSIAPTGLPRLADITIDLPVLVFILGITMVTSGLFGMIPIFKHTGMSAGLGESGRTAGASRERHRAQNTLVTVQVALAFVLLICSGLMMRTFRVLTRVNPGFNPDAVQTFKVSIPPTDVADDTQIPQLQKQIQDKLSAIPGVSAVAFASEAPLDGNSASLDNVFAADHVEPGNAVPPLRRTVTASPGILQTLGISLVAGREFNWTEVLNRTPVALISENFARQYWGTPSNALGKRIRPSRSNDWREVVGVVGDVRDEAVDKPARTTVYWPAVMANYNGKPLRVSRYTTFMVRSPMAGTEGFVRQVQQAVWSIDAKLPLARVRTLNYFYTHSMARTSFTLVMLGIAGAMALLLGTVGLYGVLAYSVAQRTREIGVRMALGAERRQILAMVVGRGMVIIACGLGLGIIAAAGLTRLLTSMLYGVKPGDPLTYFVVVLLLGLVALAACYLPARRAMRVEPLIALRHD